MNRTREVFNNEFQQPVQVPSLIKAELLLRAAACGRLAPLEQDLWFHQQQAVSSATSFSWREGW